MTDAMDATVAPISSRLSGRLPKKVLILGKFPPIQGGTSSATLRAAIALAKAGIEVCVVTNGNQVAPRFRHSLIDSDQAYLSKYLLTVGIRVEQVPPIPTGDYIPWAQPFVTELFGRALQIAEEISPDCLLSWYFEPYGVAGAFAAATLRLPIAFRHAGSDFGRLILHSDLRSTYNWALQSFHCIAVSAPHIPYLRKLHISNERICITAPPRIGKMDFGTDFDFDATLYSKQFPDWFESADLGILVPGSSIRPQKGTPNLGIFGKVGKYKSTASIVKALAKLAKEGMNFQVQSAVTGSKIALRDFFSLVENYPLLRDRTVFLPPLPPWRMMPFLAQLDAAFCLEHQFPIPNHSPLTPREILASKSCLICSRELVDKFPHRDSLIHGRNIIIIEQPDSSDSLARQLRPFLKDRDQMRVIGLHGKYLSNYIEAEKMDRHPVLEWVTSALANFNQ